MKKAFNGNPNQKLQGAWVTWGYVEKIAKLPIKRNSEWRILMCVLLHVVRYGGNNAFLSCKNIADFTNLSERTVKSSVASLIKLGMLIRPKRTNCLNLGSFFEGASPTVFAPQKSKLKTKRREEMIAPGKCNDDCLWPTCIYVSSLLKKKECVFSGKQLALICNLICESSEILGADAGNIEMPFTETTKLGLNISLTYRQAIEKVDQEGDRRLGNRVVRSILNLSRSEQIQGALLTPHHPNA